MLDLQSPLFWYTTTEIPRATERSRKDGDLVPIDGSEIASANSVEECSIRSSVERVRVGMPVSEGEENGKCEAAQIHRAITICVVIGFSTCQRFRHAGSYSQKGFLATDAKPSPAMAKTLLVNSIAISYSMKLMNS